MNLRRTRLYVAQIHFPAVPEKADQIFDLFISMVYGKLTFDLSYESTQNNSIATAVLATFLDSKQAKGKKYLKENNAFS